MVLFRRKVKTRPSQNGNAVANGLIMPCLSARNSMEWLKLRNMPRYILGIFLSFNHSIEFRADKQGIISPFATAFPFCDGLVFTFFRKRTMQLEIQVKCVSFPSGSP